MRKKIIILFLLTAVLLSGCAAKKEDNVSEKILTEVKIQKAGDSKSIKQTIEYPAIVLAEQEAKIIAKISGNIKNLKFNTGDNVRMGQELAKIDDAKSGSSQSQGLNSSMIQQASIAVEQSGAAYNLAQKNYENLLLSSEKDLKQAEIGKDLSGEGKANLSTATAESIKSAQLSYEAAVIAREQAKINLDNRKNISGQSQIDTDVNANNTADSAADTCGSMIVSINNITGLGGNISLSYKNNLGVLDSGAYGKAVDAYNAAVLENNKYLSREHADTKEKLTAALSLANKVKNLADAVKFLFDKTVSSSDLPQTSAIGSSLSGFQSAASGYQAQGSGMISQLNGALQGITNVVLNNDSTLENLQKGYELAVKQEMLAKQNLENLKVGNKGQLDNAGFGYESSLNQYNATKIRISSQLAASKSQADIAGLSYRNAMVSLQGLYDSHLAISSINGVVTRKFVSEGDTVSPGQVLATISQSNDYKFQIFANQEDLRGIRLGQEAVIKSADKDHKGRIVSIAKGADSITKRFLVEIKPDAKDKNVYALGTILNIAIEYDKQASDKNNIILPLSAIEIGQNGSSIMIVENGKVKKIPVEVGKVEGETAELKADLANDAQIIIEGNKLVQEGEEVSIK